MKNLKSIRLLLFIMIASFTLTAQTVPNGGFENGTESWGKAQPNDAQIEFDIRSNNSPEGENHARVIVVNQGTNTPETASFRVGIRSFYIPVIGGETYKFSVRLRSPTGGKTFQYRILFDDGSNMGGHGTSLGELISLTGGWKLYEEEITLPEFTNNDAPLTFIRVVLGIGGELGEVRIDDFNITQVIDNDNDGFPANIDCDDTNPEINPDAIDILDNGIDENCDGEDAIFTPNLGFEDGKINWSKVQPNDSEIEFDINNEDAAEGNQHAIVTIINQGTVAPEQTAFRIGIRTTYLPIQAGTSYRFSVRLKSAVPNRTFQYRILLDDGSNTGSHGTITGVRRTITSEWTQYEQDIVIPELTNNEATVTHIRVLVGVGGELGEIRIDDFVLTPLTDIDEDGDGVSAARDCNDSDPTISPDLPEIVENDIDENCDGFIHYLDKDQDGFTSDIDCDDNNPAINPDAADILDNTIDEDCDGIDLSIFDNLVPNWGFEEGRTGWGRAQPNNAEIEFEVIDTIDAPEGTKYAVVTTLSQGAEDPVNAFFKIGIRTGYIPVKAGTLYNFKISLKSPVLSKSFQYRILLDDGSNMGGHGSLEGDRFTITNEWVQYEQQIVIPELTNNDVPVTHIRVILGIGGELGEVSIDELIVKIDESVADRDQDGFTANVDCDDTNPMANPSLAEIPNNRVDENCDGIVLYLDEDNDGFTADVDCDDNNPNKNPGLVEIPNNGIDDDCDGIALFIDKDNDRYHSGIDCDDNNPNINPEAMEIPNSGIDENCDGINLFIDKDNDGYHSGIDCDDNNVAINPIAVEIPNNGIDENCDGIALFIDQDNDRYHSDIDCDDNNPNVNPEAIEIPNSGVDENCDGVNLFIDKDKDGFNSSLDCDDNNAAINPSAVEIPNNGVDEDCNGIALIIDEDNDGFNSEEDCNDNDPTIRPNITEIPNNDTDENCDGIIVKIDKDNDGFTSDIDCDEENPAINPAAEEIRNNHKDENCDGLDETLFEDFPWLGASVVNRNNCRGITVDVYKNTQGVDFVHVRSGVRSTLYFDNGTKICHTFPHTNCLETADLTPTDFVESWVCPTNGTFDNETGFPSKSLKTGEDLAEITLYPTLSYGEIQVQSIENAMIRVISLAGDEIRSIEHSGNVSTLNLWDLKGGYYLIQVKTATKTQLFKIVLVN